MDNNLSENKKRFSKEGAIIGGVVGAITGFLNRHIGTGAVAGQSKSAR